MGKVSRVITSLLDGFFQYTKVGAHDRGASFHLFILLINVVASVWPMVCYVVFAGNVHVVFWMGMIPQYTNLLVPVAFTALNFGISFFQCFSLKPETAKIACFFLFMSVGSVLVAAGAKVLLTAQEVTEELIYECGHTTMTNRIQDEWEQLHIFYDICKAKEGQRPDFVQQCPGFDEIYADNIYAKYIEDLEFDYGCQGFCRHWQLPLFNQNANPGTRCASALAEEVDRVGNLVGAPTLATGALTCLVGVMLSGYDHL